jgi:hypothetical protein
MRNPKDKSRLPPGKMFRLDLLTAWSKLLPSNLFRFALMLNRASSNNTQVVFLTPLIVALSSIMPSLLLAMVLRMARTITSSVTLGAHPGVSKATSVSPLLRVMVSVASRKLPRLPLSDSSNH